jgi:hypothetical protein
MTGFWKTVSMVTLLYVDCANEIGINKPELH